ncbi:hypothetical protein POVWA2_023440 [Plasmodium ovale wallikeri]|uniref:Uncharacterized protein n=1 Tax=Plasmodium ovale wallikeri TaxID=864142 RepID=A0A1A8YU02_PLAOA|nr:hypothetical protein POVWA1_023640 [Plasmodium ovale wallikeri]SBT35131.1 hypothetical protein POVWA2_023440 [Plasmodium ovale wallikeri]
MEKFTRLVLPNWLLLNQITFPLHLLQRYLGSPNVVGLNWGGNVKCFRENVFVCVGIVSACITCIGTNRAFMKILQQWTYQASPKEQWEKGKQKMQRGKSKEEGANCRVQTEKCKSKIQDRGVHAF